MEIKNSKRKNIITVSFNKAIVIVATAILASAGTAVWGTLAIANTIPFRVSALEDDLSKLSNIPQDIAVIKNDIINIKENVNGISEVLNEWTLDK